MLLKQHCGCVPIYYSYIIAHIIAPQQFNVPQKSETYTICYIHVHVCVICSMCVYITLYVSLRLLVNILSYCVCGENGVVVLVCVHVRLLSFFFFS